LRFYYSLYFCFKVSLKTAVNSICLWTCSSCFSFRLTHIVCLWKRVQKYNFFLISQVFRKVFLKIFILMFFSLIKRIAMRFYLLNISKNVAFLRVAKVQLLLYLASVSESFFENFCFHFSYRFTHSICLWTCSLSGWQR